MRRVCRPCAHFRFERGHPFPFSVTDQLSFTEPLRVFNHNAFAFADAIFDFDSTLARQAGRYAAPLHAPVRGDRRDAPVDDCARWNPEAPRLAKLRLAAWRAEERDGGAHLGEKALARIQN